jgi:hypothetical protein
MESSLCIKQLNTKCASSPTNAFTVLPHTTFLTYSIFTLLRDLSAHPLILSPFVFPNKTNYLRPTLLFCCCPNSLEQVTPIPPSTANPVLFQICP